MKRELGVSEEDMATELARPAEQSIAPVDAATMETALIGGDLKGLRPDQRLSLYNEICTRLGLNALTKPFEYITLNGKLTLYAKKDCTDQLRALRNITIGQGEVKQVGDVITVTVKATLPNGRTDTDMGAVSIGNLKGDALANALMKAITKAKRRVTLSICGLGFVDESELETIPGTREAQQDTLQRRLDEERGKVVSMAPQIEAPAEDSAEPQRQQEFDYKSMMQSFATMKKDLGDDGYYRVLGSNGHEHANEIRSANEGRKVYREMQEALKQKRENDALEPF